MNVLDAIMALACLPDEALGLPLVVAPPGQTMPVEVARITYLPADALVARGPCVVLGVAE